MWPRQKVPSKDSRCGLPHTQNTGRQPTPATSQVGKEGLPPRDSAGVTLLSWTVGSDIGTWTAHQAAGLKPPSLLKHAEVEDNRFRSNLGGASGWYGICERSSNLERVP